MHWAKRLDYLINVIVSEHALLGFIEQGADQHKGIQLVGVDLYLRLWRGVFAIGHFDGASAQPWINTGSRHQLSCTTAVFNPITRAEGTDGYLGAAPLGHGNGFVLEVAQRIERKSAKAACCGFSAGHYGTTGMSKDTEPVIRTLNVPFTVPLGAASQVNWVTRPKKSEAVPSLNTV